MRALKTGSRAWLLSSALLLSYPLLDGTAQASQFNGTSDTKIPPSTSIHAYRISTRVTLASGGKISHAIWSQGHLSQTSARSRYAARSAGISCVPYARQISGIMVVGNAWQWWDRADGRYARGDKPEPGSVLNFRSIGRMHLGHVAVVTEVVNPREIIVDQANWPSGGIGKGVVSHGVAVVDVSEANNWSAVRVELGHSGNFGSVYPTYGFIYNRPDTGFVASSVDRPAPLPVINRVPSDLRPVAEQPWQTVEMAEFPSTMPQQIDMRISTTAFGAGP